MKKNIYIFSSGELHRKQNTLYLETKDGKRKFLPVENIEEIFVFGEISINKKILEFLSQKEIIMHYYSHYGYYMGSFYPREHYNSGYMVIKQAEYYIDLEKRLFLARSFVKGACVNAKKVLNYYTNRGYDCSNEIERIEELEVKIEEQKNIESLMAIEGNIKDIYYRAFDIIIKNKDFRFEARTRRPPKNRLNALISFGNVLLYTEVLSAIYRTHLDPRIGFLHTANFRRFSLNLDIAEPFKPVIVDRLIFSLLNKNIIQKNDFDRITHGLYLNDRGKKKFLQEYDKKITTVITERENRKRTYRSILRIEAYKIEKHIIGDKQYKPYTAKW